MAGDETTVITAPSTPSYSSTVIRLGGYDRFGTAIAVADYGWTNATHAILAPAGDLNMVDALASSSLSKAIDGPVLLTGKDSLTPETLAELKKLGVKNVYIVSGTAVISETIEVQLAVEGIATLRLGGSDRYETAVNIAKELHKISPFSEVVIANGHASADAISIGAIAATKQIPILLVNQDTIPTSVSNFLASTGIETSYVIGGTAVISDAVKNRLPNVERVGGVDRFDTNREVLKRFKHVAFGGTLFFANGNDVSLIDALTGAPMVAKYYGAIVLSNKDEVPVLTKQLIKTDFPIKNPGVLGGTAVMSDVDVQTMLYKAPTLESIQNGAIRMSEEGTILQNVTINGSVILGANGQTLKNATVNGTVFVDPGVTGSARLENVTATTIAVLSGADHTVVLSECNSENGYSPPPPPYNPPPSPPTAPTYDPPPPPPSPPMPPVPPPMPPFSPPTGSGGGGMIPPPPLSPRIILESGSILGTMLIQSNCILDLQSGSTIGDLIMQSSDPQGINVSLGGEHTNPITASGNISITSLQAATISEIVVVGGPTGNIVLNGGFELVTINGESPVALFTGTISTLTATGSSIVTVNPGAIIQFFVPVSNTATFLGGGLVNGAVTNLNNPMPPAPPNSSRPNTNGNTGGNNGGTTQSSAKLLTSFSFNSINVSGIIDTVAHTVAITVPVNTDIMNLTPTMTVSDHATISPIGNQDFTEPVVYTVTAENGSTQTYTVTVTNLSDPLSSANEITGFQIDSLNVVGVITISAPNSQNTISIHVPFGTSITALSPTITLSEKATVSPASEVAVNFTDPINYTVTAEDGTVEVYAVTVVVDQELLSSLKAIIGFSFASLSIEGVVSENDHTIVIDVPYDTDLTALVPTIVTSANSTVSPSGLTLTDYTNDVIYTVTAQDLTTQTYTIHVNVLPEVA